MKYTIHLLMLVTVLSLICGCRTSRNLIKEDTSEKYEFSESVNSIVITRDSITVVRDTVIIVHPSPQSSISIGRDSSHLQTEYAHSDAWIDSFGKLCHTIGNKDYFPITVPGAIRESHTNSHEEYKNELNKEIIDKHEATKDETSVKTRFLDWLFYPIGVIACACLSIFLGINIVRKWITLV